MLLRIALYLPAESFEIAHTRPLNLDDISGLLVTMSVDPYHAVQQEVQGALQTASQLHSSFLRIRNMARSDSEELMWARNEVCITPPFPSPLLLHYRNAAESNTFHARS
jgi:hypothetical protein